MTQRRIIMYNQLSADGFFSDPEGGMDWVVSDPEIHLRAVESMPNSDTLLLGRRTYQQFAAFWPNALADRDRAGPHGSNKRDPAFSAMAHWLNESRKLVVSKTLKKASWNNTELLDELDAQQVTNLKRGPGKDIMIFGSGSVVTQLTEHRLIDEYRFVVCPVLLGQGKTLLGDVPERVSLKLADANAFKSGNVMLTYHRADVR
jgi:dihydrofolate reductase